MEKDYGPYNNDIWDLLEFIQGTADIRLKYLGDEELINHLKTGINSLDKARSLLVKKSENISQMSGLVK